jgi:type VI secretion system protein VasD
MRARIGNFTKQCLSLTVILLVSACAGSAPPPEPEPLTTTITASANLNPTLDQAPQRLDIMIFQLSALATFNETSLFSLYPQPNQARETLGIDLLDVRKRQVNPDSKLKLELKLDPKTRFIGVLAAFEQLDKAQWRDVIEIRDESLKDKMLFRSQQLNISLEDTKVSLSFK